MTDEESRALFGRPPPVLAEIVKAKPGEIEHKRQVEKLKELEDDIYEKALTKIDEGLLGAEIDGDEDEPPEEWVAERGARGARRALRVAKDIRLPASVRPGYFDLAKQMVAAIAKSRENRGVQIVGPLSVSIVVNKELRSYDEVLEEDPASRK